MQILVTRVTLGRGRSMILSGLSEEFGRGSVIIEPPRGQSFYAFSLLEAALLRRTEDFLFCRDGYVLDAFEQVRSCGGALRSAFVMRSILERCLPLHAPLGERWSLVLSLFGVLPSFTDWKAAPLLLALTFFEDCGVCPAAFLNTPSLSSEARDVAQALVMADEAAWRAAVIPEDLFLAGLETVGITRGDLAACWGRNAKGGT